MFQPFWQKTMSGFDFAAVAEFIAEAIPEHEHVEYKGPTYPPTAPLRTLQRYLRFPACLRAAVPTVGWGDTGQCSEYVLHCNARSAPVHCRWSVGVLRRIERRREVAL